MKPLARILGIDDGPFRFQKSNPQSKIQNPKSAIVVGALMRAAYLEAVMAASVTIDGSDATERLIEMVERSRYREQVKAVLLDGCALGGFNVVDIRRLHDALGVPVATVTRDLPDMEAIRAALRAHFPDWPTRWAVLAAQEPAPVKVGRGTLHSACAGLDADELRELLNLAVVRGNLPEPLRVAHLIATAIMKGESRGRA